MIMPILYEKFETIRNGIVDMRIPSPPAIVQGIVPNDPLQHTFTTVVSGLTGYWYPVYTPEFENIPPRIDYYYDDSVEWDKFNRIYGVVDKYTGYTGLDKSNQYQYPKGSDPLWPPSPLAPEDDLMNYFNWLNEFYYKGFLPKYSIRTLKLRKALYRFYGLPELVKTVNHLKTLAGKDLKEGIYCGSWSLREVANIVWDKRMETVPVIISVRDLASKLGFTDCASLLQVFDD